MFEYSKNTFVFVAILNQMDIRNRPSSFVVFEKSTTAVTTTPLLLLSSVKLAELVLHD
jgi:hypothetical protein